VARTSGGAFKVADIAAILKQQAPLLRSLAQEKHVVPDIHPNDMLFDFLVGAFPNNNQAAIEAYIRGGEDCARKFAALCAKHLTKQHPTILEFASGYGRVSRYAKQIMPDAEWVCSDVHPKAVDFIADKMALVSFLSSARPQDWTADRSFDAVFALSFFSHMPKATFGSWLARLFQSVSPGGVLIFTTHGEASLDQMKAVLPDAAFDESGFYWNTISDQHDLDSSEYGSSAATKTFVEHELRNIYGAELIQHEPAFWWAHQDLYVVRRA
jgi:cyclopropane fatty-acyl-phospholipid synthase-like methyltransferase